MPFLDQLRNLRSSKLKIKLPEIQEDRRILLICFGIALVFWVLVKLSQTYRMTREVTFDVQIPEGKALVVPLPGNAQVIVEGSGWSLLFEALAQDRLLLKYDLQKQESETLSRIALRDPIMKALASSDLHIVSTNYESVSLELENRIQRRVPIQLRHRLTFAPEYDLQGDIVVWPDSVDVSGPASMVSALKNWPTDTLRLFNLAATSTSAVQLMRPPIGTTLSVQSVKADVEVEQFTEKSLFVQLVAPSRRDSIKFFPDRIKLTCVVGLSHYDKLTASDFELQADLSEIHPNQLKNTVPIVLTRQPEFVRHVYFSPQAVEFFILK